MFNSNDYKEMTKNNSEYVTISSDMFSKLYLSTAEYKYTKKLLIDNISEINVFLIKDDEGSKIIYKYKTENKSYLISEDLLNIIYNNKNNDFFDTLRYFEKMYYSSSYNAFCSLTGFIEDILADFEEQMKDKLEDINNSSRKDLFGEIV